MRGPGMPMPGPNAQAKDTMLQNMTAALALSAEEIGSTLQTKKAELGLNDAQIKKLAPVIEASQRAKLKQHVESMGPGAGPGPCGYCLGVPPASK